MKMDRDNVFSVSEVNRHIHNVIDDSIPKLFVEGEIANFTHHRSGHIYFSLKDEKSTLRCVFFKAANLALKFQPKTGDKVICLGKISVYEKGGNYQLTVNRMIQSGIGDLQLRFEELKQKLKDEGLFDNSFKKAIPKYPESIGIVTSSTGAAVEDIRNVISRRYPTNIYLYPATVQGDKAAKEIIKGINYFNEEFPVDVLIIGRGGGSQEDLFCFNDETLVRKIFASKIPVISAVGHEIDFTISDFVADLRAPTPSAAAELAVPDRKELTNKINNLFFNLRSTTQHYFTSKKLEIQELENALDRQHPKNILKDLHIRLEKVLYKLSSKTNEILKTERSKLEILYNELKELSPQEALKRGYSIIRKDKKILNSIETINISDKLQLILADGKCLAEIIEKQKNIKLINNKK
ncbi:MAG: exodeoxyribonuclease VII large subunit [Candidatus Tenebribacter davisii]|jgi:exodeoxyribonuclease VII large subunit|nr:exodeoxyribonuclease VII large subunit [Candidatus Tenebribacter davisii]